MMTRLLHGNFNYSEKIVIAELDRISSLYCYRNDFKTLIIFSILAKTLLNLCYQFKYYSIKLKCFQLAHIV